MIEENEVIIKLVECSDSDVEYGALIMPENLIDAVQQEIYAIKERWYEEGFDGWCTEELIEEVQKKYPEVKQVPYLLGNYIEI